MEVTMTKTISERVLNVTMRRGEFNRQVVKESFKLYDNEYIHNSVMRRARELAELGLLRRTGRGNYAPVRRSR
jgi:hypothetical protein